MGRIMFGCLLQSMNQVENVWPELISEILSDKTICWHLKTEHSVVYFTEFPKILIFPVSFYA